MPERSALTYFLVQCILASRRFSSPSLPAWLNRRVFAFLQTPSGAAQNLICDVTESVDFAEMLGFLLGDILGNAYVH